MFGGRASSTCPDKKGIVRFWEEGKINFVWVGELTLQRDKRRTA